MKSIDHHADNRIAWNEAAAEYEASVEQDIAFLKAGGKNLWEPELRILHDLGDWCGRAIHLQCAGGRDTLSLWNQGAAEVVGVDISERMIACAQRKSDALGAPAQWFLTDILKTPNSLDGTADLVYTGRGALNWIMDINAWAEVVKRLLKPGGVAYIFEGHPLDWVWDADASTLVLRDSYFANRLVEDVGWPSEFISPDRLPASPAATYESQWTLGEIVTALAQTGLRLEILEEDLRGSLDFEETIMKCEDTFGISIPNDHAAELLTVGKLALYIEDRIGSQPLIWPPPPIRRDNGN